MTNLKLNLRNISAEKYLHYYQDDVDSIISELESKLIVGRSGCGKTILMQELLLGYIKKKRPTFVYDNGYSYRHLSQLMGLKYIDVNNQDGALLDGILNKILGIGKKEEEVKMQEVRDINSDLKTLCNLAKIDCNPNKWIKQDNHQNELGVYKDNIDKKAIIFNIENAKLIQHHLIAITKYMYLSQTENYVVMIDEGFYALLGREKFYKQALKIIKKYGGELVITIQPYEGFGELENLEKEFDKKIEFKKRGEMLISPIDKSSK